LDVSGSVNATAIATGGTTAKQIDCGKVVGINTGAWVSFHFTFINVPIVIVNPIGAWTTNLITSTANGITTTGFTFYGTVGFNGTTTESANNGNDINWIAIG